jgi:hypothetical protein
LERVRKKEYIQRITEGGYKKKSRAIGRTGNFSLMPSNFAELVYFMTRSLCGTESELLMKRKARIHQNLLATGVLSTS